MYHASYIRVESSTVSFLVADELHEYTASSPCRAKRIAAGLETGSIRVNRYGALRYECGGRWCSVP